MTIDKLADLALELTDAIRWYWNFYVTVILAILGWFIKEGPIPHRYRLILTAAFMAFVSMNLLGLVNTGGALSAITAEMSALSKSLQVASPELRGYLQVLPARASFQTAWLVHVPIDLGILFLIWSGTPRPGAASQGEISDKAT